MEQFTVHTRGGPKPGDYVTNDVVMAWPLPDVMVVDETAETESGGHYQKVSESDLPAQEPGSLLVRGAMYEWVPDQEDWVVGQEVEHELLARKLVKKGNMPKRNLQLVDASTTRQRDMADIDDEIVFCRARGLGGHDWPKLRPGKRIPKNFQPVLQRDGTVLVTELCGACGKTRWYESGVGGAFDMGAKKHYKDPRNWKVLPRDLGYSSRDFDAEAWRRLQDDIMRTARQSYVEEDIS
jgi:hypothetical protein